MITFLQQEYNLKPGETVYVKINGLKVRVRRTKQFSDNTSKICIGFEDENFPELSKKLE